MKKFELYFNFLGILFLVTVLFIGGGSTAITEDKLNLWIAPGDTNIKWSNISSIQFVGLKAKIKLICEGSSPTKFEFFMGKGDGSKTGEFELWTERLSSNNSSMIYRSILQIELHNHPVVTEWISCVSTSNRIDLQGSTSSNNGTESTFYTVGTKTTDSPSTQLRETDNCEIEFLVQDIHSSKVEWTCRRNQTNATIRRIWPCRRIPECTLLYPKLVKSCVKLLGPDEPCPNCVVSSTLQPSILHCEFTEGIQGNIPMVYTLRFTPNLGIPIRYYHWLSEKEELENMVVFKKISFEIYINDYTLLRCIVSETYFSKGVKFTLNFINSTEAEVLEGEEDTFIEHINYRVYTLKLFVKRDYLNVEMVNCKVPIWNSTEWVIKSQKFSVWPNPMPIGKCNPNNMNGLNRQPVIKILPIAPAIFSTPEQLVVHAEPHFRINCSSSEPVKWTFDFKYDAAETNNFQMESGHRWKRLSNGNLEYAYAYSSLLYKGRFSPSKFICESLLNPCFRSTVVVEKRSFGRFPYLIIKVADVQDSFLPKSPSCTEIIHVQTKVSQSGEKSFEWFCARGNLIFNSHCTPYSELFCSDPLMCSNFFGYSSQQHTCLTVSNETDYCKNCRSNPPPKEGHFAPRYLYCGNYQEHTGMYQYIFFSIDGKNIYLNLTEADPKTMMEMARIPETIYKHSSITLVSVCRLSNFYFGRGAVLSLSFENGTSLEFEDSDAVSETNNVRSLKQMRPTTELCVGLLVVKCSAPIIFNGAWFNKSQVIRVIQSKLPMFADVTLPKIKYLQPGDSLILNCQASGIPQPTIEWTFPAPLSNYTFADMDSVIEINDLQPHHNGLYNCTARNKFGRVEKTFAVNVYDNSKSHANLVILGSVGGVLILVISLVLLWYIKRFRKMRSLVQFLTDEEVNSFFNGTPETEEMDAMMMPSSCIPYSNDYEIPSGNIVLSEHILGCGEFGVVYKGSVENSPFPPTVAIKTMKKNIDVELFKAVLSEIKVMIYLGNHENIVTFFGACTSNIQQGEIYIAIELCDHGNLLKFLRTHRQFFMESFKSGDMETSFTNINDPIYKNVNVKIQCSDLVRWSLEIANGMAHLEAKNVIHGDIAARNVLLSSNLTVKISDFGLSRQLTNYSSYIKTSQCALPWRWMALESLRHMTFSIHSDVWAYAITIWEIFSLGEIPYPGTNWDFGFVAKLDDGLRLLKPEYASDQIFEKMLNCWLKVPNSRPTFEHLKEFFRLQSK